MEVRFSEALPLERALRGGMPSAAASRGEGFQFPPITVVPNRSSELINGLEEEAQGSRQLERDTVKDLVERTAELLSKFDRELKYEMQDDAGVMQMQVIDTRDGRVVRKVPADEVVKFIEHIKAQIDDRVDVLA